MRKSSKPLTSKGQGRVECGKRGIFGVKLYPILAVQSICQRNQNRKTISSARLSARGARCRHDDTSLSRFNDRIDTLNSGHFNTNRTAFKMVKITFKTVQNKVCRALSPAKVVADASTAVHHRR
jgi:hypothetical protein